MEEKMSVNRNKVDVFRELMKVKFERLFDDTGEISSKIDGFISQLDIFKKNGLVFNKEEIIAGLRACVDIKDKVKFVNHLLKVFEPLILLKFTQSRDFEKAERDIAINSDGKIKLSEVLSASFEDGKCEIHLAPASELIKDVGIGNFKKEIEKGLVKLADVVKSDQGIKEIWATSWIVAKNPTILRKMGFTIHSQVSKEEAERDYNGDKRPLARAFMGREDFLLRYLINK